MTVSTLRWRLDRRISLTLIFSLFLQFLTLIVWATCLEARVGTLETRQADMHGLPERLARLEERVKAIGEDTSFIRQRLSY